jgi:hypothetical protein
MNKNDLIIANRELKRIIKNYDGLNNVILDNWRGYRFIFDSRDVKNCQNDCENCRLNKVLKQMPNPVRFAKLIKASEEDKKIFGGQNYLNCKTISQYKNCFVNFIVKKTKTKSEICNELNLVRNLKFIFSRSGDGENQEKRFKNDVIMRAIKLATKSKRKIIIKCWQKRF